MISDAKIVALRGVYALYSDGPQRLGDTASQRAVRCHRLGQPQV